MKFIKRERDCLPDVIWVPCVAQSEGRYKPPPPDMAAGLSWAEVPRVGGICGPREDRALATSKQFHAPNI